MNKTIHQIIENWLLDKRDDLFDEIQVIVETAQEIEEATSCVDTEWYVAALKQAYDIAKRESKDGGDKGMLDAHYFTSALNQVFTWKAIKEHTETE